MQFALTTQANDGAAASINGAPIFLGVTVGNNGIAFEGRTINVGSKGGEEFLAALSGSSFRDGLSLLTTVQPALKPFVGLASSVVGAVLKRSQNKQIHSFSLGFDFSEARLRSRCVTDRSRSSRPTTTIGIGHSWHGMPAPSVSSGRTPAPRFPSLFHPKNITFRRLIGRLWLFAPR
jgi:hypothetical protein